MNDKFAELNKMKSDLEDTSLDEKFTARVQRIVEANLGNFTFSVEKLAGEMNLSRAHLLRKMKALMGQTAVVYIREMRLHRAAHLLKQKADTVTQIGYKVGFNDQPYFTRSFKKRFGMTPSEYMDSDTKR